MKRLTMKVNYGSSWVESIETDEYVPLNYSTDTAIGKCVDKLGKLEDLLGNADTIRIIKRNGVASLHIDMILDNETYPIAEELFGKEKVEDYDK